VCVCGILARYATMAAPFLIEIAARRVIRATAKADTHIPRAMHAIALCAASQKRVRKFGSPPRHSNLSIPHCVVVSSIHLSIFRARFHHV
jgi:hypothetical protein